MEAFNYKRTLVIALGLGSVVLAGTMKDMRSRNVSRASVVDELTSVERSLASSGFAERNQLPSLPMNEKDKVNGYWEITKIVGADEQVAFDRFNNPSDFKKVIKIKLQLIGNGVVRIDDSNDQVYRVRAISSVGTISLVKKMNGGEEILEASRIRNKEDKESLNLPEELVQSLVLERALNQAKSSEILTGPNATGELSLRKESIERLSITLTNTNGEVQNVELSDAPLLEGGTFSAESDGEKISGVIFNNGKEGYRLSFVTGPMAGAMLNFVTEDYMHELEEKAYEQGGEENNGEEVATLDTYEQKVAVAEAESQITDNNEGSYEQMVMTSEQEMTTENRDPANEVSPEHMEQVHAQEQVLQERGEINANINNEEPVEVLTADEIRQTAETQGFGF